VAAAAVDDGGGREQRDAAVPAGEPVGGVDGGVAAAAERGLVGAAQHRRLRPPARVAPDLHVCALVLMAGRRRMNGGSRWRKLDYLKQLLLDRFV